MKLLLDTNIWIWSILAPRRLSRRVASVIDIPRGELWLSSVSVWEVLLFSEKGHLRLGMAPELWIDNALERMPLRDAPVTREVARESRRLPLTTSDPADRFIAATARVYDLTLVTSDEALLALKGIKTLSNL